MIGLMSSMASPKRGRGHARLVALHPVDVAGEGVDLAIVGEHAEGLRQAPRREGVGRVALMVDGEVGDEALVQEVGVEGRQLLGQEHALVDDRAARQRAHVEVGDVLVQDLLLDAPADDEEIGLEGVLVDAAVLADHDLLDLGARRVGLLADDVDVDRHLAPAVDGVARLEDLGLDDAAAALLGLEVGLGKEDHADGEALVARLVPGVADMLDEEVLRDLQVDAGAVAGLPVGVDGAAVPHLLQGADAVDHDLAAGHAVDGGDETDAAGVVLFGRVVEAVGGEAARVLLPGAGRTLRRFRGLG